MRASLRQVLFRSAGLDLNFAGGVFSLNNTRTASPAAIPGWSFSRTDTNCIATALDLAGNVIQFATGVPRITNRGILVEEARTNVQLRSDPLGAVAGSPGTAPTGWTITLGLSNGVTRSIAATGTDSSTGLPYVDISFVGTFTAGENVTAQCGTAVTVTAASVGQAWSASMNWAVVSGALPAPLTASISGVRIRYGSPGLLAQTGSSDTPNTSFVTRQVNQNRVAPASTTVVGSDWLWSLGAGQAIDCTVRFGHQQLELGSFATSPIITTGAAGTRGADNASVTIGGIYTGTGTLLARSRRDVASSNVGQAPTGLSDGTTNNEIRLSYRNLSSNFSVQIRTGAAEQYSPIDAGTEAGLGVSQTIGLSYGPAAAFAANGNIVSSDASVSPPVGINRLGVGTRDGIAATPLNGYVERIQMLPYAATNAQLQALTAP